jgi:hypothetical protein
MSMSPWQSLHYWLFWECAVALDTWAYLRNFLKTEPRVTGKTKPSWLCFSKKIVFNREENCVHCDNNGSLWAYPICTGTLKNKKKTKMAKKINPCVIYVFSKLRNQKHCGCISLTIYQFISHPSFCSLIHIPIYPSIQPSIQPAIHPCRAYLIKVFSNLGA